MQIHENFSLKPYNTFGIDVKARYFATFSTTEELTELITNSRLTTHDLRFTAHDSRLTTHDSRLTTFTLGGGSNILLTKNLDGLVLKNDVKGIKKIREDDFDGDDCVQ